MGWWWCYNTSHEKGGVITWPWLWVLAPIWIPTGIVLSVLAVVGVVAGVIKLKEHFEYKKWERESQKRGKMAQAAKDLERQQRKEQTFDNTIDKTAEIIRNNPNINREELLAQLRIERNKITGNDQHNNDLSKSFQKGFGRRKF